MNRSRIRKALRRSVWAALVFFLLYFTLRSWVLDLAVQRISLRMEESKGLRLSIGDKGFFGFSGIWLSHVSLQQPGTDTLLSVDTLAVRPALLQLLIGRIGFDFLRMEHARLLLSASGDSTNYSFWLRSSSKAGKEQGASDSDISGYGSSMRRWLVRSFAMAPQEAVLKDLRLELRSDTLHSTLVLDEFVSDSRELQGRFSELSSGKSWKISGDFSKRHRTFHITAFPLQSDHRLPLLRPFSGLTFGFDTLHMDMSGMEYSGGELRLTGGFSVKGMDLYHARVADDTVRVDHAAFDYRLIAGERYLALDSQSVVRLNTLFFHPYLKLDRSGSGSYAILLQTDTVSANDFFSSLPEGMFDEVRSIRGDGRLAFRVAAELDASRPDSVRFSCTMRRLGFRLRNSGGSDIFKLNTEFIYEVFENGRFIRSFPVGPSNPDYTALEQVAPYFRNSVLTSEDGNFFYHNGFNEEAFRRSIAENFKAGKFKRGGSTITMQLVKNVFLTRKKTVARKAEEALIVWLIESGRLVSKERLLEVYFNIIELGPDVYGIGEASRFYFNKKPDQLDLSESIFLAGLLPRPKWFKSQFDTTGALKPYVADYYRVMSNFMLRKGLISESEHAALVPNVVLTGPARDLVLPEDTVEEELPDWIPGSGQ